MRANLILGVAAAAMAAGFAPAATAQDQPGDASTSARLAPGATVDGEISPAGETDWFRLSVQTGQRYSLTLDGVAREDGSALDPVLSVYDARGNQLAFNDDTNGLNSALRYAPSAAGDVFVEARAFSEEDTGAYRLSVASEVLPADAVGNDSGTRARVSPGRPVNGTIDYEGDVDSYRLDARRGHRYHITLAGAGENGLGDPYLVVADREGAELISNDDSEGLNSALEFIPTANGPVYVQARAYGDGYTGAYTLNMTSERLPTDAIASDRMTRGRITIGQSLDGALDFPSDADWYRVRLTEGQSYRFTLSSGSGENALGDPLLRVHNAAGEELAMDDDGGGNLNSYLEFTAPTTGNYYLEARGFSEEATGGYTLAARDGDIPADATTDVSLSADGDYREGMLAPGGDRDWYRIELTEGQALRIAVNSAEAGDALGDPYVILYDAGGGEVGRDDDGGDGLNAWLEYQAATAGTYYIEARGFIEDAAGRYAVMITAGEIGDSADNADALPVGGEGRTSIIGAPDDVDWFAVELIEGRPYRFWLDGVDPEALADPYITLFDSQGRELASDDDGGAGFNSYLSYTSATGGSYFVAVSSYGASGTGRYFLRGVDTDVPGNAYTDENLNTDGDDSRNSRIDIPDDLDVYRVSLEAGVRYQIDVRGHGDRPLADAFVAVLNGEGEQLATDDDGGDGLDARLRFTPTESGEYLIQASGLGGSTGDYQVQIVRR